MDRPQQTRRNLLLAALGAPLLMRAGGTLALDCRTALTSVMGPAYRPHAPAPAAWPRLGGAELACPPGGRGGKSNRAPPRERPVKAAPAAGYAAYAGSYDLWLDQKLVIAVADRHLSWTLTRPENAGEPVSGLL